MKIVNAPDDACVFERTIVMNSLEMLPLLNINFSSFECFSRALEWYMLLI